MEQQTEVPKANKRKQTFFAVVEYTPEAGKFGLLEAPTRTDLKKKITEATGIERVAYIIRGHRLPFTVPRVVLID